MVLRSIVGGCVKTGMLLEHELKRFHSVQTWMSIKSVNHQRGEGIRGIATMVRVNAVCRVMSGLCILIRK